MIEKLTRVPLGMNMPSNTSSSINRWGRPKTTCKTIDILQFLGAINTWNMRRLPNGTGQPHRKHSAQMASMKGKFGRSSNVGKREVPTTLSSSF